MPLKAHYSNKMKIKSKGIQLLLLLIYCIVRVC